MRANIAVLPGDGIGPEVVSAACAVLDAVASAGGHDFDYEHALIGGVAMDACGAPLPPETVDICRQSDAVLLGAVGGPKWDDPLSTVRPEQGLLAIRKALGLYANLRPVTPHPRLAAASPIKASVLRDVDFVVVRELTGGIYFGEKSRRHEGCGFTARDVCTYSEAEVERVARVACALARARRSHLTSVDKANVLETSRLWREVVTRVVLAEFADVALEHMLVDACAMHLIVRPSSFDVIVTENMFGDILTDEASVLAGSIGVLPSASLGDAVAGSERRIGLYEPIHGSAPTIAGMGIANPMGAILSAAMMLRLSLGLDAEAVAVERAVDQAISLGIVTPDLAGAAVTPTGAAAVTQAITDAVGPFLGAQRVVV